MNDLANHFATWSQAEDDQLSRGFLEGLELKALAEAHGRSKSAIVARLMHLRHLATVGDRYYKISRTPWCFFRDLKK